MVTSGANVRALMSVMALDLLPTASVLPSRLQASVMFSPGHDILDTHRAAEQYNTQHRDASVHQWDGGSASVWHVCSDGC